MEMATGVIARVDLENRRFVVRPAEGDRIPLRFRPETIKVELDGKEAKPDAMQKGQRAEVEYAVRDDKKLAQSVKLRSSRSGRGDDRPEPDTGENGSPG